MSSRMQIEQTETVCSECGRAPNDHLRKGLCMACYKRKRRDEPGYAARERVSSKTWKDRNRERNRARDRARAEDKEHRGNCTECAGLMGIGVEEDGTCKPCQHSARIERAAMIANWWAEGWMMKQIAEKLGYSMNHMAVEIFRIRRDGLAELPHRYPSERRAAMKAGRWGQEVDRAA